jgi:hypothetical protein
MEIYFSSSIARTARVLVLLPLAVILLLTIIPAPTTAQDAAPKSRDSDSSQSHAVDDNNQRPHENPTTLKVKSEWRNRASGRPGFLGTCRR